MSVYGAPVEEEVDETTPLRPVSIYGVTKSAAERLAHLLGQQYRVEVTSFRLFSVYGPGQNLDNLRQGIVSIYLAHLLREGQILVKGRLDRFRDLIYVDDVVEAFFRAAATEGTAGEVFNLGTGTPTTVQEMVDQLRRVTGKEGARVKLAPPTPGDTRGIVASMRKFESVLGWRPRTPFVTGLRQMVDHYRLAGTET